jgi:hypothetical protein
VVTIFYAVYHFCTSQLLSTSAVLYIVLKLWNEMDASARICV